jgi:hypothetical protein
MSYDYTPLKQSADRLIQRFGQAYTFTRTAKGSYDPATGTTSDTTSTFEKSGILFDYFDGDSAGETVLAGDRRLIAEAHSYEVGDTLVISSETYRVISVSANQPAGTMMLSTLQIRK